MKLLIGIFPSSVDVAEEAGRALRAVGVAENHLLLLTPEGSGTRLQSVSPRKDGRCVWHHGGTSYGSCGTGFASGVLGGAAVTSSPG